MEQYEQVWNLSLDGKLAELKAFLKVHLDVDVNLFQDAHGQRALHAAAYLGHAASTRLLINAKADLEAITKEGSMPLFMTCASGELECLQALIESKADVQTADDKRPTPAHMSCLPCMGAANV